MATHELFDKARRFNTLLTEHQIRTALSQPLDEEAFVEICSLYLQVRDGLRVKARAEGA